MTSQIPHLNDTDLELLSAYLDSQVSEAERRALEARLEREPELRMALDELRATTQLLRELPVLSPPRSLAINPASVQPRWQPLVAWLRFGSAITGVLLALTITLDLAGSRSASIAQAPAASAPAAMSAPAPEAAPAAGGVAGVGAAHTAAQPTAAAASGAYDNQPANAEQRSLASPTGAPAQPGSDAQLQAGSAADQSQTNKTSTKEAASFATHGPEAVAASEGSSPDTIRIVPGAGPPAPAYADLPPIRLVQFSLAGLALLLGLASLWVARRGRG